VWGCVVESAASVQRAEASTDTPLTLERLVKRLRNGIRDASLALAAHYEHAASEGLGA
jgi:hypothetical protein